MSRASRSFSFGFLGLCVYVILSLIDRFDFLAGTRCSCSLQGPKPRRGWRLASADPEGRGEAGEGGRGMRERQRCTGRPSADAFSRFQLSKAFLWSLWCRSVWPPPGGFRSRYLRAPPPRRPPGSAPRLRAPLRVPLKPGDRGHGPPAGVPSSRHLISPACSLPPPVPNPQPFSPLSCLLL